MPKTSDHAKRFFDKSGPRPFDFSQPAERRPLHRRSPITRSRATPFQLYALEVRRVLIPVNRMVSIMLALFIQLVKNDKLHVINYDASGNLTTIGEWINLQPNLFRAQQDDVKLAISWVTDFRDSFCHKWLGKTVKYFHEHLSAVIVLAGPTMINDPATSKTAEEALRMLNPYLSPLETLPSK